MKTRNMITLANANDVDQFDALLSATSEIEGGGKFVLAPTAGLFGYIAVAEAARVLVEEHRSGRPLTGDRLRSAEANIASACRLYVVATQHLVASGGHEMAQTIRDIAEGFDPLKDPRGELQEAVQEASEFAARVAGDAGISEKELEEFKASFEARKGLKEAETETYVSSPEFVDQVVSLINANSDGPSTRQHVAVGARKLAEGLRNSIMRTQVLIRSARNPLAATELAGQIPQLAALLPQAERFVAGLERVQEAAPNTEEIMKSLLQ